jgi:hypothetical protein
MHDQVPPAPTPTTHTGVPGSVTMTVSPAVPVPPMVGVPVVTIDPCWAGDDDPLPTSWNNRRARMATIREVARCCDGGRRLRVDS